MNGYVGVNGTARKIKNLYIGVNGVARKVNSGYIGVNGAARKWFDDNLPICNDCITFSSDNQFRLSFVNVINETYVTQPTWDGTLEYSTNKKNWNTWDGSEITSVLNGGKYCVYVRGYGNTHVSAYGYTSSIVNSFYITNSNSVDCIGNIETLLDYREVANGNHPVMGEYCFYYMFTHCTSLTTAPELPTTRLASYCYNGMFWGCTSLTTPPVLPATTLAEGCYDEMFCNCTSLTTAPKLPATTLAPWCYADMFFGCTSLTTAPALPVTTLTEACYEGMFGDCASLTTAPKLPATRLKDQCYWYMFAGCTSLTTPPQLPATTLADHCYSSMFQDCTSLKVSSTKTGEYQYTWRIPKSGTGRTASSWNLYMLNNTGGTFASAPSINTTYYVTKQPVG